MECSSQENPFGYLGTFTSDRYALLVIPDGGKLIKTPTYKATDNQQIRKIEVSLADDGNATAEASTTYTGILQEDYASMKTQLSVEDQKKELYKTIEIPSFELNNFSIHEDRKRSSTATVKLSLAVRKCASKSGIRMFLTPNLMSIENSIK